jgi:hypothetical protein
MAEQMKRRAQLRTATLRIAALGAFTACLMAMLASNASAEYLGHVLTGQIEGAGTHPMPGQGAIAVDNSSGPSHGAIYVTDGGGHRVQKYDSAGNFVLMFGDEVNETTGGDVCPVNPADVCKAGTNGGGSQQLGSPNFVAVDNSAGPSKGDVYVSEFGSRTVRKYSENGVLETGWATGGVLTGIGSANGGPFSLVGGIVVDNAGNLAVLNNGGSQGGKVIKFQQDSTPFPEAISSCVEDRSQSGLAVSPDGTMYYKLNTYGQIQRFTGVVGQCVTFSKSNFESFEVNGKDSLVVDPVTGTVYGVDRQFGPPTKISEYLLDGTGKFPLNSAGVPCPASAMNGISPAYEFGCPFTHAFGQGGGANDVAVNSSTNTVYVTENPPGGGPGRVNIFSPLNVPKATTGVTTAVAQTTATVTGNVDPDGAGTITDCYFEFGPTTTYGNKAPCVPAAPINSPTNVEANFTKLSSGHLYHYRIVAVNALGSAKGSDKTLTTTAPPSINSFSSSDHTATTAILHATIVPNSVATQYRFEYGTTVAYGTSIPVPDEAVGAGSAPVDVEKLLTGLTKLTYHFRVVAHNALGTTITEDQTFNFFPPDCPNRTVRQATGSDYLPDCRAYELVSPGEAGNVVFFPNEAVPVSTYATDPARLAFGGGFGRVEGTNPPNGLSDMYVSTRTPTGWETSFVGLHGEEAQDNCQETANRQLSLIMTFRCEYFILQGVQQPLANVPFVFNAAGKALGKWPVSAPLIPEADSVKGAFQPSPDFSHLAFSSNNVAFAPNGLIQAPGSAYDYNPATGATTIISKTASGQDIAQEPGNLANTNEAISFPGVVPSEFFAGKPVSNNTHPSVSTDGSHILMSTRSGPSETAPIRLYMRVNDAVTYEVSGGKAVNYVGMTEDGSKVFFLAGEQMTGDDTDTSVDLFVWQESTDSIERVSVGEGGTGNTDVCTATGSWTTKCSVRVPESENPPIDNVISGQSGDIYFYSPERLVGVDAAPSERNLYLWHDGEVKFVTAANLNRIQVTPDNRRMAFITNSRITSFDNKGFREMYTYDPGTEIVRCVSCPTEGKELTGNVVGSLNGRFITDDGRTFFFTPDAQVPYDTNEGRDIYEFVDGRPQLITTGTGDLDSTTTPSGQQRTGGLVGVSADGVNAYFATFESLVPEDQNGPFIKFYVARTGGGFPIETPLLPCEAADECHGPVTNSPQVPALASGDDLGSGGNAVSEEKSSKKAKAKRRKHKKRNKHRRHVRRFDGVSR